MTGNYNLLCYLYTARHQVGIENLCCTEGEWKKKSLFQNNSSIQGYSALYMQPLYTDGKHLEEDFVIPQMSICFTHKHRDIPEWGLQYTMIIKDDFVFPQEDQILTVN